MANSGAMRRDCKFLDAKLSSKKFARSTKIFAAARAASVHISVDVPLNDRLPLENQNYPQLWIISRFNHGFFSNFFPGRPLRNHYRAATTSGDLL
jgi:hypothetical protein